MLNSKIDAHNQNKYDRICNVQTFVDLMIDVFEISQFRDLNSEREEKSSSSVV